jgi:ABC-type glycerol-3-phosphate transport system permease component
MLSVPAMQTIPVSLSSLVDKTGTAESLWSILMAGTAVGTFPLVVLFLFCQRFFVAGLLSGAVKGQ